MIGEIAVFLEAGAVFEVDKGDFGIDSCGFSFFGEFDEGIVGLREVIIYDIWGGGTLDAGNFKCAGDKTGEAEGGIAGGVVLVVG